MKVLITMVALACLGVTQLHAMESDAISSVGQQFYKLISTSEEPTECVAQWMQNESNKASLATLFATKPGYAARVMNHLVTSMKGEALQALLQTINFAPSKNQALAEHMLFMWPLYNVKKALEKNICTKQLLSEAFHGVMFSNKKTGWNDVHQSNAANTFKELGLKLNKQSLVALLNPDSTMFNGNHSIIIAYNECDVADIEFVLASWLSVDSHESAGEHQLFCCMLNRLKSFDERNDHYNEWMIRSAVQNKSFATFNRLLEETSFTAVISTCKDLVHEACTSSRDADLKIARLLTYGFTYYDLDPTKGSPLAFAVSKGNIQAIKALMNAGAHVLQENQNGVPAIACTEDPKIHAVLLALQARQHQDSLEKQMHDVNTRLNNISERLTALEMKNTN